MQINWFAIALLALCGGTISYLWYVGRPKTAKISHYKIMLRNEEYTCDFDITEMEKDWVCAEIVPIYDEE